MVVTSALVTVAPLVTEALTAPGGANKYCVSGFTLGGGQVVAVGLRAAVSRGWVLHYPLVGGLKGWKLDCLRGLWEGVAVGLRAAGRAWWAD